MQSHRLLKRPRSVISLTKESEDPQGSGKEQETGKGAGDRERSWRQGKEQETGKGAGESERQGKEFRDSECSREILML